MEPRDDRDDRPPVPRGWAWGGVAAATGLAAAMIWVDLFLALVPATLILLAVTAVRTPRPRRAVDPRRPGRGRGRGVGRVSGPDRGGDAPHRLSGRRTSKSGLLGRPGIRW